LRIIADFGQTGDSRHGRIHDDHDFAGCYPALQLTGALRKSIDDAKITPACNDSFTFFLTVTHPQRILGFDLDLLCGAPTCSNPSQ
jgi:hypothetical protein